MKKRIKKKKLHREQKKIVKYLKGLGLGPEIIKERYRPGYPVVSLHLHLHTLPGLILGWIGTKENPRALSAGLRWYEGPGLGMWKIVWKMPGSESFDMPGDLLAWKNNPELFWQDMARIYQKTPEQVESDCARERELYSTMGLGNEAYTKAHDLIEETKAWIVEYIRRNDLGWGFYPAYLIVARDIPREILDEYDNNCIAWTYEESK
jgi:hypothetical protein